MIHIICGHAKFTAMFLAFWVFANGISSVQECGFSIVGLLLGYFNSHVVVFYIFVSQRIFSFSRYERNALQLLNLALVN